MQLKNTIECRVAICCMATHRYLYKTKQIDRDFSNLLVKIVLLKYGKNKNHAIQLFLIAVEFCSGTI